MDEARNDLHLTSTGRGHEIRNNHLFPPLQFRRSVVNQLPPLLKKDDNISNTYMTTTGTTHNYKPSDISMERDIYKKAPGHWDVDYVEDTIQKLHVKPQRKPLTMGLQCSEMKDQFQGKKGISLVTDFSSGLQPPVFIDHHQKGPLKSAVPSTQNPKLAGQKFSIQERGVLTYHSDPYLSTTQKDHRFFSKQEKSKYPKKEYATYWECEGYPKAWGHGSKHNPLPPDSVPREKGPMWDHTWFRTGVSIPRIPKPLQPVPNSGQCTEVRDNYKDIPDIKRSEIFKRPVPTPWDIKDPGEAEIFSVPKMYNTEYQTIGSQKTVMI